MGAVVFRQNFAPQRWIIHLWVEMPMASKKKRRINCFFRSWKLGGCKGISQILRLEVSNYCFCIGKKHKKGPDSQLTILDKQVSHAMSWFLPWTTGVAFILPSCWCLSLDVKRQLRSANQMVIKDPTKRLNSREFSLNLQFVMYVTLRFEDVEILRFHSLTGTFLLRYKLSPLSRFWNWGRISHWPLELLYCLCVFSLGGRGCSWIWCDVTTGILRDSRCIQERLLLETACWRRYCTLTFLTSHVMFDWAFSFNA